MRALNKPDEKLSRGHYRINFLKLIYIYSTSDLVSESEQANRSRSVMILDHGYLN